MCERPSGTSRAPDQQDHVPQPSIAERTIEQLRAKGVRILVAESQLALAHAHLADGSVEAAVLALDDAIQQADRLGERRVRWEARALLGQIRIDQGAVDEASRLRRQANAVVREIAADIEDPALRKSFLTRDEVLELGIDQ